MAGALLTTSLFLLSALLLLYPLAPRTPLTPRSFRADPRSAPRSTAPPCTPPAPVVPASLQLLSFPPAIRRVIVNVGANRNPPTPRDAETAVIAVEPVLQTAVAIPPHPRVFVVVAAISNVSGLVPMFTYNMFGESSTLASAEGTGVYWADPKYRETGYPPVAFVPVLTLEQLLSAIPPHLTIPLLKTDMQGYDFMAVSACPLPILRRAEQIFHEANCEGYEGMNINAPRNDMDGQWMAFMEERAGYLLTTNECAMLGKGREGNALWTRDDVVNVPEPWWWELPPEDVAAVGGGKSM